MSLIFRPLRGTESESGWNRSLEGIKRLRTASPEEKSPDAWDEMGFAK